MGNGLQPVIDAHAHCGVQDAQDWMPGFDSTKNRGQSAADLLRCMDTADVDCAVLHTNDVWGMKYTARMIQEHDGRFIGICKVDGSLAHTESGLQAIQRHVKDEGFRGLYFDPWPPTEDAFTNFHARRYEPLWDLVDQMHLPVCVVSYGTRSPDLFPGLIRLVDLYPNLTITIVHGLYVGTSVPPDLIDEDNRVRIDPNIIELVRNFDVSLEILAGYPGASFGPNDAVLQALFDTFGPRKLLWGSEFTKAQALSRAQSKSPVQYASQAQYLQENCPYLLASDRAWIMGGNAARIYVPGGGDGSTGRRR